MSGLLNRLFRAQLGRNTVSGPAACVLSRVNARVGMGSLQQGQLWTRLAALRLLA